MNASLACGPQIKSICGHVTGHFNLITQKGLKTYNHDHDMVDLMLVYIVKE